MHLLLFVFYSAVLCYLLISMRFFRDSGIKPSLLLLLFGLRVAAGCLHNLAAWRFYPHHGDIWAFFDVSFITRQELFHDLPRFMADNAIWAYLPYNLVIFMHILFNLFSFDNMYINTLLFSFIVFAGSIALFRAIRGLLHDDLLCAACALLIPSTLYWTACIHKEGLIYLSLGFFFFHLHGGMARGWNKKRVILSLLFFCMTAFFRSGIAATLLPGLALWRLKKSKQSGPTPWRRVKVSLAIALSAVIMTVIVKPSVFTGILSYASAHQMEFQALRGNSRVWLPVLEPRAGSFLHALPAALLNGFFQPLPGSGGQAIYLVFSFELILIWMLVIYGLFSIPLLPRPGDPGFIPDPRPSYVVPASSSPGGFALCCLVFSFSGMLLIGYIVPFAGAIIRYRSLYLPFLLVPFIHLLHRKPFFERLNQRLGCFLLSTGNTGP